MKITARELRRRLGEYLRAVARGEELEVTYRGRSVARISPIENGLEKPADSQDPLFGVWADRDDLDVDSFLDGLRKERETC